MKDLLVNMKFAWKFAKKHRTKLILYGLLNFIGVIISIIIPILSVNIIVGITANKFKQVLFISIIILGVELLRNTNRYFMRYFSQTIYRETFTDIQSALGSEILKIENKCIDSNNSGVFIQRLTNDTSKIADIFNVLNMYLTNIIANIGIFAAVFIINRLAFLYLIIMVLCIYFIERKRVIFLNQRDKEYRKSHEQVSGFIGELVRGIRDIKMLNAEESFMKETRRKVENLNKQRYAMSQTDRNYGYISECLREFFATGMIFLLVFLIMKNTLTIASALVIHNYMGRVTSIVNYLSLFMEKVKDFNLSSSRIFSILDSREFPKEEFGTRHLDKVEGNFEFKNVSFSYEKGKKVLDNISFQVNANETVAFVGKSGAGKTTIFNLLCKMYNVDRGEITIDGIDIRELDKNSIRGNITVISQNPYIFNLSIKDNLKLVKQDVTDIEIKEACKTACLDDFIKTLPDGYDTIVGEGGITLSGGQRQRLAIARALVQKTEIILFDEATSALDNETQASIQTAIENMKRNYTILIIAHRLSTVISSDRILYLDKGKIEAEGTHEQLLKSNSSYRHLYETEMNK